MSIIPYDQIKLKEKLAYKVYYRIGNKLYSPGAMISYSPGRTYRAKTLKTTKVPLKLAKYGDRRIIFLSKKGFFSAYSTLQNAYASSWYRHIYASSFKRNYQDIEPVIALVKLSGQIYSGTISGSVLLSTKLTILKPLRITTDPFYIKEETFENANT